MSVLDKDKIDGLAYDKTEEALVMLITDHLDWNDEYSHLISLQDKINSYVNFCETKQYEDKFSHESIKMAVIDVHSLHEPTENGMHFLQRVQNQLGELGFMINATISK